MIPSDAQWLSIGTVVATTNRVDVTYFGEIQVQVKFATFDIATATNADVVAAVSGKKLRVLGYTISGFDPAHTGGAFAPPNSSAFEFRSGTTTITNLLKLEAEQTLQEASPHGLFETTAGAALNIRVTAAGGLSFRGYLRYIEV